MSTDLQARKRKEKKRRKEDEGSPFQPTVPLTTNNHSSNDDVTTIHVHKEGGLGGGICAKLVFFVLFSALAVLIGLIITEHRGLSDVDVVDTNSKFSQMFEGWTDSSVDHHEDDLDEIEDVLSEEHDDHDEEEEPETNTSEGENEEEHGHSDEDDVEDNEEDDKDTGNEDDEDDEQSINEDDVSAENEDNEDDSALSREQRSVEENKDYESTEADDDRQESEENEDDEDVQQKYSIENISEEENEQLSEEKDEDDDIYNGDDEIEKHGDADDREDNNIVDEDQDDEEDKAESEEQNVSKEEDELNESDENEKTIADSLSKEEEGDDEDNDDDDEDKFVRKASQEISKEQDRDIDDEENKSSEDDVELKEDKEPGVISTQREPDDNVQESSGSPSKVPIEVGEALGSLTKNITKTEQKLNQEIDDANDAIDYNPAYAVKLFDKILEKFPSSPRSIYGKALALNHLADQKKSNEILYNAIQLYTKVLKMVDVPDELYKEAVEKTIKVMRFVGQYRNLIEIHKLATNRFPENPKYYNELVVTYLTINRIDDARFVLNQVLKKWPNDGFALVHQGFILKTNDNKLEEAVDYFKRGMATHDTGVKDGRFYFHLGDALERLGKHEEAMQVYEEGTKHKLFLSKYQRSLYNVKRLTGKPFWEEQDLPHADSFRELQQHWRKIRDEGLSVLNEKGYFQDESENLRDTGEWKQFELFARGQKNTKNCAKSPFTCSLVEKIPEAKSCKRGQTKFSIMHPGTHVWPHCGPTNCRLRVHLGLKVPPKTFLRVADKLRTWKEGKILIFDDSFEHEVWHNGTEPRLVLIVDIWHPELSASEKRNLSPI